MTCLKTHRLVLRNLETEDLDTLYDYRNNALCAEFQRWEDTSRDFLAEFLQRFGADVFLGQAEEQHYAIALQDGSLTGDLSCFYDQQDNCITLGITISHRHHRRGYAFEMLSAVVEALREQYPTMDLVALIEKDNAPSIALFQKLGFEEECYAQAIGSYVYTIFGEK